MACGYRVLARTEGAGVDVFEKSGASRFVFMQGHPEYGPEVLGREYRRDVHRFLAGDRQTYPAIPTHYLDATATAALERFRQEALVERRPGLLEKMPTMAVRPDLAQALAGSATLFYRNWIAELANRRPARLRALQQPMTASSV